MPSATARTSAPTASQTLAISLMNEILVARNALDAYLIISAVATVVRTTVVSMSAKSCWTSSPSVSRYAPITMRSGCRTSSTAAPSRRNSGLET